MSFEIPDLHNKWMRSVRNSLDNNLRPYDSHIGYLCSSPDPELHSLGAVGGHFERLLVMVVDGLSADSFGVAAMVDFC